MTHYGYERLSALDNLFLVFEGETTPMHVGSVTIFAGGALATPGGGVDGERIKAYTASRLGGMPRYRERLARIPVEEHPVWVDDQCFDIDYHIRHTSLPKPGNEAQLKQVAARIMAQPLDLTRPLWETWIVEGLEGGSFALLFKVHHCMIDGISGADLLSVLLSPTPDPPAEEPMRWIPRRPPSGITLLRDEVIERVKAPLTFTAHAVRHPLTTAADLGNVLEALVETVNTGLRPASETPLNQPISAHRRLDWTAMELAAIRAVRAAGTGTVNDVVLATVAGAVRTFLRRRGVGVGDLTFRTFVPVNLRDPRERGTLGNHVSGWIIELPIGEPDPRQRLRHVAEITARLKGSNLARGTEVLTGMAEWIGTTVLNLGVRLAARNLPFNLVVTNVPGPPMPLYLLGARLQAVYPYVPLFNNLGLGIALFSNAGTLFWGFNADREVVPDVDEFVGAVRDAFAELCAAAAMPRSSAPPKRAPVAKPAARTGAAGPHQRRNHKRTAAARDSGQRPTAPIIDGPGPVAALH